MFWTRFVELCNKAEKSPNAVAAACGVKSSGTVTGWRNGSIPRTPVLHKMADYFNVTADYLLGKVDLPFLFLDERGILDIDLYAATEIKKPTPVSEGGLNEAELRLVALYRNLNFDGQEKLLDYADDLVSSGKYIKEKPASLPYAARKSNEPHTSTDPDTDVEI